MSYYNRGLAITGARYSVGGPLFHTVGDRTEAVKKLGTEFAMFQNDLMHQLGWSQDHPAINELDPRAGWWRSNMMPVLNEWQSFQAKNAGSWVDRFATSWDTYDSWQKRLASLRDSARSAGFDLTSPDPQALPKTIFDNLTDGVGQVWSLTKTLVWVAVIVGGLFVLIKYVIPMF